MRSIYEVNPPKPGNGPAAVSRGLRNIQVQPVVGGDMELESRLVAVAEPEDALGAVLVLHGGASRRGAVPVSPTQLSVVRMIPVALRIAAGPRLAVYRLLNTQRGWYDEPTPAQDARLALDQIRERLGRDLPAVLVGHSLGGRAALLAGDADGVVGVAALAAYVVPGDEAVDLTARRVLFVHGTRDRIASLDRASGVARVLARQTDVGFIRVAGGTHSMLRHHSAFDGAAADFASALLADAPASGAVGRVLAGESAVEI